MTEPQKGPARLWGGRFAAEPTAEMDRLNRSLPVDHRLWREDIAGSRAWAAALGNAGVITQEEAATLRQGLAELADQMEGWSEAQWNDPPDEDIHSLVERLLRESVGEVAAKLHTGRSRNDQVATDTRLWAMGAVDRMVELVAGLQTALLEQAEANRDVIMPAYTHLQRAQPISASHWLLSHAWALDRDRARLVDCRRRVATLPLGSGAIAGCPFPVDREALREQLGFETISPNSIDAVGDRDWVAEILFCAATVGVHLSRLGEDLILFTSSEFGFVRLSDAYSTGSSLMPQKRNPDAMELARGKAGRLIGGLMGALTLLKGLPTGYNKDLQEDKDALFDAVDTLDGMIPAVIGSVATLKFNGKRTSAAVDPSMLATDLAEFLVREGVPFRSAHEMIGRLVRMAEEKECTLPELAAEDYAGVAPEFSRVEIASLFDPVRSRDSRSSAGGTGSSAVDRQIQELRKSLAL